MEDKRVQISVTMSAETKAKANYIARKEWRSLSRYVDRLIRQAIAEYEENHSSIQLE